MSLYPNLLTLKKFTLELQSTKSFTHEDYTNDTELSKEYQEIKMSYSKVTWSIARECSPYNLSKKKVLLVRK